MQVSISFLPGPLCRFTPSSSFNNSGYQGNGRWGGCGGEGIAFVGPQKGAGEGALQAQRRVTEGFLPRSHSERIKAGSLARLLPVHFPPTSAAQILADVPGQAQRVCSRFCGFIGASSIMNTLLGVVDFDCLKEELCCTVYIFWKLAFLTQEIDLLETSAVQ